jgi:hypothetical protein
MSIISLSRLSVDFHRNSPCTSNRWKPHRSKSRNQNMYSIKHQSANRPTDLYKYQRNIFCRTNANSFSFRLPWLCHVCTNHHGEHRPTTGSTATHIAGGSHTVRIGCLSLSLSLSLSLWHTLSDLSRSINTRVQWLHVRWTTTTTMTIRCNVGDLDRTERSTSSSHCSQNIWRRSCVASGRNRKSSVYFCDPEKTECQKLLELNSTIQEWTIELCHQVTLLLRFSSHDEASPTGIKASAFSITQCLCCRQYGRIVACHLKKISRLFC